MTYVEFFDKASIENVCSSLTSSPEKVILIGSNIKLMSKYITRYNRVFSDRSSNIEFICRSVNISSMSRVVELLSEIVESEAECAFDLTGGDDIVLAAMGVVYERYKDKNIQMHRFNIRNGTINDCDADGTVIANESPSLSSEENIRLYGGDIVYNSEKPGTTPEWIYDSEFKDDIALLWMICRKDVRLWNTQIGVFEAVESYRTEGDDTLLTVAGTDAVNKCLARKSSKSVHIKSIINNLISCGLITYFNYNENFISIAYKNKQVKSCLTKAGRVLEMKIYAIARDLKNKDESFFYDDVVNGAFIDWDGDIHRKTATYDTENEIDIILMKGLVPVFVSCKNGHVTIDELYKLNTVAERFGSKYSKKVIVATALDRTSDFGGYFRQRAKDMNIRLVENIQSMNDAEMSREVGLWWCN